MNTRISHLILGLAVLGGLSACTHQLLEEPQARNAHRVHFAAGTAQTKTGITVEDGLMTPDWRKTDAANVHLFEIGNAGYSIATDVAIALSDNDKVAHFTADFPTDMTIIVDPSKKNSTLLASNESNVGPYYYAAIVAQATESAYIVPAIQHPDAETLIDPSADFLIGYSRKSYEAAHNWEENVVDLYFDRPVALGRINFSSFEEGEKVKSIVIKAPGLSGSTVYKKVDFENATVTFTPSDAEALTLDYGNGVALASDGTFSSYFVALPGKATISEIVVTTDKYIYTKTVSKEITFSNTSFKNLKLDLTNADKEEAVAEEIKWYKASVLEDGIDYIIVSGGYALKNNDGTLDTVEISPVDGIITFDSAVDPTIVWRATAKEIAADDDLIAGHFTLSNGESLFLQRVSAGNHEYEMGVGAIPGTVKYYAWDYDGQYLYHVSNSNATFYCFYNSGWVTGYQNQKAVQIYTSRPPQELSFSETAIEFNMDGEEAFVAPTLSGAQPGATVTFTSSNETVATVDEEGNVNILKAGTTVITAVAAGNADFQAGSASYTIIASSGAIDTFYLASEIVAGESYMVVSGGYAISTDGSTLGTVPVTVTDGIIHISAAEVALFEAAAHIEYYEGTSIAGHYTLANDGKYLQRHSDQATQTGAIGAENGKYYVWEYDGEHLYQISRAGSSGTYYFYYSSGWTFDYQSAQNAYLYTTTKQKTSRNLSFSEKVVKAVLGQGFTAPELNGVTTSVAFASSNTSVATVDATSGEVTLVGLGETTITASAPADDEYNAGSASYTLMVTDGNVPTWYKVEEITSGVYMVISNGSALENNEGNLAAETNTIFSGDSFKYEEVDALMWEATGNSTSFTLKNDGKYLRRSSSSGLQISSTNSSNACTFDGTYVKIASSYVLYCNNGSWTTGNSTSSSRTVTFYSTTPPKQSQELAFSAAYVEYDLAAGGTFTTPTLSGAQTTVTYSSNKPAVATVDTSTGEVTIGTTTGTVTITATAEETETYKPATATYTLKVIDSSAPVTTKRYVLASEIVDGKDYLIVSGGYALKNDGGSVASVAVTPVDGTIEFESGEDDDLAWTAKASDKLPEIGDYTFTNGNYRINRKSSSGSYSLSFVSTTTEIDKYQLWLLQMSNDDYYFYHNGNGNAQGYTYYLYYSSGWKITGVKSSTPSSSEKPTQLFVKE